MRARLLLRLVQFIAWRAQVARTAGRYVKACTLDEMGRDLVKYVRHLPPTPVRDRQLGKPFSAKAVCQDIDCREKWDVVSLGDTDPLVEYIECPKCDQETGVLV